jgi:hypothetical protein
MLTPFLCLVNSKSQAFTLFYLINIKFLKFPYLELV